MGRWAALERMCATVSDAEFDDQAATTAARLEELPVEERIAAACRGSGNPVALAWLAENLRLEVGSTVVDLGAGLGGPAAWLALRYGVSVAVVEPAMGAAHGARALFGLPVVQASADAAPLRDDSFDAALLLGVLSVLGEHHGALREAWRIARSLAVLDYCTTGGEDLHLGGSTFRSTTFLTASVSDAGWAIDQTSAVATPSPRTWTEAASIDDEPTDDPTDDDAARSEREVVEAIEHGRLAPYMLTAHR